MLNHCVAIDTLLLAPTFSSLPIYGDEWRKLALGNFMKCFWD